MTAAISSPKSCAAKFPAHKIHEDDDTLAFMDVMPQSPGHVLVIPKAPSRNLLDADPAALSATIPVVQKIARAVKDGMQADGIFIAQFNEEPAGADRVPPAFPHHPAL